MKRLVMATSVMLMVSGCQSDRDFGLRTHTDTWYQSPNNEVDILWVVDNSCSMTEEQDTLARGFESFVGQLEDSGTDFHIGVISTSFDYADGDRGKLIGDPPYLTKDDDYVGEFATRAQMGIEGSDKEKGLEAAAWALSPAMSTGPNAGFLRPDAQLLVIIVSDEEDCSDGGALEGQPAEACYTQDEKLVPVAEFIRELQDLKASDDLVQVGAIVGVRDAACEDAYPGDRYVMTAALTGGLVGDICLSDWSTMLVDLGLNATGVRYSFQLSYGAVEDSLEVLVDGEPALRDPVAGWAYDPTTWFVSFGKNAVPPRGSEITASYTIDPGAPDPTE